MLSRRSTGGNGRTACWRRLTGAVFLLPFLFFLLRGTIPPGLRIRLCGHLCRRRSARCGRVVDGVVGPDARRERLAISSGISISRSPPRSMRRSSGQRSNSRVREPAEVPSRVLCSVRVAIAVLLLFQIYLGALVAGLDAGLVYQYLADDRWHLCAVVRSGYGFIEPAWRNLFENTLTVQFQHRMVAYAIWLLAIWHALRCVAPATRHLRGAAVLAGAVTLQAGLGIVTLLHQAPLPLALAHQMLAIIVFTIAVVQAEASVAPRID